MKPVNVPNNALKTINRDNSISWKWENSEGFNTFTENLPPSPPIFHCPRASVPIPAKRVTE